MDNPRKKRVIIGTILFLTVIFALALRLYKIDNHLRGELFFEEPKQIRMVLAGDIGHFKRFNYPPFFNFWLSLINSIYFCINYLSGHFKNFADLIKSFNIDYSLDFYRLLLSHRVVTAVIGSITVPVVFLIGKNLFGLKAGLLSALFFAVLPIHIYTSMDAIGPDNLQLLFICLAFFYISKLFLVPGKKEYLFAGLFIGLAVSAKYFGIFCLAPLLLAHFLNKREAKGLLRFAFAAFFITVSFTFLPEIIRNPQDVVNTVNFAMENFGQSISSHGTIYNPLAHIRGWSGYLTSLKHGLGPGIYALSVFGLVLSLIRHNKKDVLVLIFPLVYYLFIGYFYHGAIEYFLPVIPFVVILAANFLSTVEQYLKPYGRKSSLIYLLVFFLILPSLWEVIYFKKWSSQSSVESQAKKWVINNIEPGSLVLFDGSDLGGSKKLKPLLFYSQDIPYQVSLIDWRMEQSYESFFKNNRFDYVIIDSSRPVPEKVENIYGYIRENFELVKEFTPLFPTPRHNSYNIYCIAYNHSYMVFKNRSR